MKVKYLLVLTLALLLVAACGPQMATPTPQADTATTEAAATAVPDDPATPDAGQVVTPTVPLTPTGGVDVALAAIEPVDGVLATVNGQDITWADYEPELNQSLYGVTLQQGVDWNQAENLDMLPSFQDEILQTVIARTLLRQAAAEKGVEASQEDVQARVEEQQAAIMGSGQFDSWDQFLEDYGLSEEYLARLVEDAVLVEQLSESLVPDREVEQVHARHILVADEATGQQVLTRLDAGEEWAALASEFSQDTSNKDSEGDLGWFPRGAMVSEFEEVAFSLEPGETSELVQTDFGFHIIQVLEKGNREVDEQTYQAMTSQAFQSWLEEQKAAADIEVEVTFAPAE